MVDIATGEVDDRAPRPEERGNNPFTVPRGRLGGLKGRKAPEKAILSGECGSEIGRA
jgi:hypothetical protein